MIDVLIVGGGMAGLSAAYELNRRGLSFAVLDAAARAGGVVLSEEVDGFIVDAGPDSLLVQKPAGVQLCQELGLGERLISTKRPRLAYVQRAGRLHALPAASVLGIPTRVGPFLRTGLFSWSGKLRMGAEVFVPPRPDAGDESVGHFMRRRFGAEATTYLAEPLLAGIHAGDVDRLSIRALFPRFVEAERQHGSLLRAFRRPAPPHDGQSRTAVAGQPAIVAGEGAFRSLPGGLSELVRALTDALPRGSIRLRSPVKEVSWAPHGSAAGAFVTTDAGERIDARALVLATPAFETARLLRHAAPEVATLCGQIDYASTATVALAFDERAVRHPLNGSGFVVPRVESTGIMAASWLSSKWPGRAPGGRLLMRAFAGGARDAAAVDCSDAELVTRSLSALTPLLHIVAPPLFTRVYRWRRASAQHEVGHLEWLASLERALDGRRGLFITGSGFRGVGIPDCVSDGRATAVRVDEFLAAPQRTARQRPA